MTEIRIWELTDCPTIFDNESFLESDIELNFKFNNYELSYGFKDFCSDCGSECPVGITYLTIKENGKEIFDIDFNKHWILFLTISKIGPKRSFNSEYRIDIDVHNMDDGDVCETCINNRYHFTLNAVGVKSYSLWYHCPSKGPWKPHMPDPKEELDNDIKEELK